MLPQTSRPPGRRVLVLNSFADLSKTRYTDFSKTCSVDRLACCLISAFGSVGQRTDTSPESAPSSSQSYSVAWHGPCWVDGAAATAGCCTCARGQGTVSRCPNWNQTCLATAAAFWVIAF